MIGSCIFSILFIVLAVIFLIGKGDKLIAGYNTASEEERQQVDIRRLRISMAIVSVITAVFCAILPFIGNEKGTVLTVTFVFILITIVFVILANTWAKNK